MRNSQIITLLLLITIFTVAVVLTVFSFFIIRGPAEAKVSNVPDGSQEIAVLLPAAGMDAWERFVGAMKQIKRHWTANYPDLPDLNVDASEAFPQQSAAVPEMVVWVGDGKHGKLLIRWYKLSAGRGTDEWIADLTKRPPPPLAIIGGENTRRAQDISRYLQKMRGNWPGQAPLFLITTATADKLIAPEKQAATEKLIDIYAKRSYRFSFTNSSMTRAVLDFVQENPELLWPEHPFVVGMASAMFGAANPLANALPLPLYVEQKSLNYAMFGVSWDDDPYSEDLCDNFSDEFKARYYPWSLPDAVPAEPGKPPTPAANLDPKWWGNNHITYSTGDFFNPNQPEAFAALNFSVGRDKSKNVRQILVLPASTDRARRFLKAVINCDPLVVNNLIVVSGDSITFNLVYRDHKVAWNILDLPVPLVFFTHRSPVYSDPTAQDAGGKSLGFHVKGTKDRPWAATGTQDLLLYRDILEALCVAAYRDGTLVPNADELDRRLQKLRWVPDRDQHGKTVDGHVAFASDGILFFDANHNRSEGTGEYVVLLQPQRASNGLISPQASLTVWSRKTQNGSHQSWEKARGPLNIYYTGSGFIPEEKIESPNQ